ncbi:[4Fe-4S] proteins maturation [Mortierella polycephala]|uniref:[4Fe-4S] proteins maturation n=1 Tax=Mortierella polycephala TaxID=41804 RepID=A0A9P6PYW4_9FUNG|nr:[4Fe-4S] proteins maturation [Mortierella polycephala]
MASSAKYIARIPRTAFIPTQQFSPASTSFRRTFCAVPGTVTQPLRFFSSAAVQVDSVPTTPTSELKVQNPQFDEAGKELIVEITDKAAKQLKHIATRDQNPLQALRVTVDSGGCHGYQYLMDLTDAVNEDDVVFDKDGARVIIDTITLPMVSGSRIDFIEELIGSAFKVVANPHAAHSCGCDTSFEIKI